jgi:DNA-binding winged helix-turn-helix (wHTH) protein/Tol biopolymer transport system component
LGSREPHVADRASRQYSFGEFTLDLDGGFLRRGDQEVSLRPKPFEVLVYLVARHGRLVTKEELIEAVWPDTSVMDNSLAQCLVEIRKGLGDDSQQLIRTVPRRGYLFTGPVASPLVEFPRVPDSPEVERGPVPLLPERATKPVQRQYVITGGLALLAIITAVALPSVWPTRTDEGRLTYTQVTNFTDSVVSPALSPDGKMLAFIRSDNWFLTPGQIYVKLLPDGEPIQITDDPRPKYGLTFSPDGSRIVYTVFPWSTYAVSPLGGQPTLFLTNSSGVTWVDERRILFSEVNPPRSTHMGVVTAMEDRSQQRTVYVPHDERGMVHLAYPSPDRKWVLVLEMNPVWQPCRVVPMDGSSSGRQVAPQGSCTSAGWSPDGKWMYFGVDVNGDRHLWRQQFPDGEPEQITFGPTEEDGVAVLPDGRSLITSVGTRQSVLWIHDGRGDRLLSSQGYVSHPEWTGMQGTIPAFSRDGKSLFYLRSESPGAPTELWRADVASETSEKALPGIFMVEFDLSDDAQEVLYSVQPRSKPSQLWVARFDRSSAPQMIASSGGDSPYFGPDGRIIYRSFDGAHYYLAQMNRDGSGRSNVVPYPVGNILSISPDRRWITTVGTMPGVGGGTFAVPIAGGPPRRICSGCPVTWSLDGGALYLFLRKSSLSDPGKTRVVSLRPGEMLPTLPPSGMRALDEPELFPGSHVIDAYGISPGPDPSVYAYVKTTMHRNLFRIPLR